MWLAPAPLTRTIMSPFSDDASRVVQSAVPSPTTAVELAIARMAVEPVREVEYGFLKLSKGPPAAPN